MADDTIAFLESVVGQPADLVGHSDGAFVSGEAAPDAEWNLDEIAELLGPAYGEVCPDGIDHFKVVAAKIGEMAAGEPPWTSPSWPSSRGHRTSSPRRSPTW
jgi:hypothetical protein